MLRAARYRAEKGRERSFAKMLGNSRDGQSYFSPPPTFGSHFSFFRPFPLLPLSLFFSFSLYFETRTAFVVAATRIVRSLEQRLKSHFAE